MNELYVFKNDKQVRVRTTEKVARLLGVTVGRVRQLVRAGRFPDAVKVPGGSWLIPDSDIADYLTWPDRRRNRPETTGGEVSIRVDYES